MHLFFFILLYLSLNKKIRGKKIKNENLITLLGTGLEIKKWLKIIFATLLCKHKSIRCHVMSGLLTKLLAYILSLPSPS